MKLIFLNFEWIETHGGALPESIDGGLGSKVLRLAIPYELDGTAEITVIENGIHFKTSIPIEAIKISGTQTIARLDAIAC